MITSISNGNSTVNQRIKQEFVAKHVYCKFGLYTEQQCIDLFNTNLIV